MSRAVIYESFGGPEVLEVREVPQPHAGPGEVRVRVAAVGLNPMDWGLALLPEAAARFGITVPSGFGYDFAGVVDEVGPGVDTFAAGDRVFGGAMGKAAADYLVMKFPTPPPDALYHTPDGLSDELASTLPLAGSTAVAALDAIGLCPGATVIGTASESTFEFLRTLGAEPVAYGAGLVDRVRKLAPDGVTAATNLVGTETVETALALGVPPERISTIAVGSNPPDGVRETGGSEARPDA